jgi:hypothetical protein
MLNIADLGPCPNCGKTVPMLNPGKGELWYLQCARCPYSTDPNEDPAVAFDQWGSDEKPKVEPRPTKPKRKAVAKKPAPGKKGKSKAALVREKINELLDSGRDADDFADEVIDYGFNELGFATRGASKSCFVHNLANIIVERSS